MSTADDVKKALREHASEKKATLYKRFFKTGPGEYGEGDIFIGVTMPDQRAVAKRFKDLPLKEAKRLLRSEVHEHRMTGLVIMTLQFAKADERGKRAIYDLYLSERKRINNWDLVDVTTPRIIGAYLLDKPRDVLYELAEGDLWEKRIAMLATFMFLYHGDGKDTLRLAERYLSETHDLTHKATGWALREVGKRVSGQELEKFLRKHYDDIPRTTLRYAIERFPEQKRQAYLKKAFLPHP